LSLDLRSARRLTSRFAREDNSWGLQLSFARYAGLRLVPFLTHGSRRGLPSAALFARRSEPFLLSLFA